MSPLKPRKPPKRHLPVSVDAELARAILAESACFDRPVSWVIRKLLDRAVGPDRSKLHAILKEIVSNDQCANASAK